jgi:NAD/NADP transhydrogenase alpha subunit
MKKGEIIINHCFKCASSNVCYLFSRVALSPVVTAALVKKGFSVNIEKGAGFEAKFRDEDYLAAGGKIVDGNKAFDSGETIFPPEFSIT